jgi:hypothetical protein
MLRLDIQRGAAAVVHKLTPVAGIRSLPMQE